MINQDKTSKGTQVEADSARNVSTAKTSIQTVRGEAQFVITETEDSQGRWNDDYSTKDGYYVIHRGTSHDVYLVKGEVA